MLKITLAAALCLFGWPAEAATKIYDVERIHLQVLSDIPGKGWLFMEDVKGVRSALSFVLLGDEGDIIYNCHVIRTGRDFNIVNVGPFAQQATGQTTPAFMGATCGAKVTALSLTCPYLGIPAPLAFDHQTIAQSGTYRTTHEEVSSYKITGHSDQPDFCTVSVSTEGGVDVLPENLARLSRLSQAHTGDTAFRDFVGAPPGWLTLRDVTFPF